MTSCCKVASYQDPMFYDETNARFGTYDRCAKCERLVGRGANISRLSLLRKSWTALSEVYTREYFKPGEARPLRFRMEKCGLVPCGFSVPVKEEAA